MAATAKRLSLAKLMPKLHKVSHLSSTSSLGSDWLGRSSSSSWDLSDYMDSDDDTAAPPDVPEGFLAVYVGRERKRFVIETHYLNHPIFKALLDRSAEEYGFEHSGGLNIACDVVLFEHLLYLLKSGDPAVKNLKMEDLLEFYSSS